MEIYIHIEKFKVILSFVVRVSFEVEIQNAHNMIVIVRGKIFKNTTLLSLIK